MTINELKEYSGMNIKQMAEYFETPYRTMQNWLSGTAEIQPYLLKLMEYKLTNENYKDKIAEIKAICEKGE